MLSLLLALLAAVQAPPAPAGKPISLPADNDEYAMLVKRAESGDEKIDFLAMRHAWLKSAAYKRASITELKKLRKELGEALRASDDVAGVREAARKILGIAYVDLDAQKSSASRARFSTTTLRRRGTSTWGSGS